jgi:cytochrome c peroxidase
MSKYTYFSFSGGLHYKKIFVLTIIIISICSCRKDDIEKIDPVDLLVDLNLPEVPFDYENIDFPNHFLNNPLPQNPYRFQFAAIESDNTPVSNPTTNEGALLGRVLFYEKKLSKNGTIACASCHKQETGFSDTKVLSIGFEGGLTRRHSMTLTNARFYDTGKFFWDERPSPYANPGPR